MHAIGAAKLSDREVMEALMPGSTADLPEEPGQARAISIKGLTPGMGFTLAECCHPVPGDRIVGLRREGEGVQVHSIDCDAGQRRRRRLDRPVVGRRFGRRRRTPRRHSSRHPGSARYDVRHPGPEARQHH